MEALIVSCNRLQPALPIHLISEMIQKVRDKYVVWRCGSVLTSACLEEIVEVDTKQKVIEMGLISTANKLAYNCRRKKKQNLKVVLTWTALVILTTNQNTSSAGNRQSFRIA